MKEKLTLAIAGNPNCGKTTLFNALTGSDQRVGNWPGVTVEKIEGSLRTGALKGTLTDLPGIYTLVPDSEDEMVARRFLTTESYDLVINIVDAANLERNLYLTTELAELGIPMVLVLNKIDLAKKNGITIDSDELGRRLGIPVFPLSATDSRDIRRFSTELEKLLEHGVHQSIPGLVTYPEPVERFLTDSGNLGRLPEKQFHISPRSILLSILEEDRTVAAAVKAAGGEGTAELERGAAAVRKSLDEELDMVLAEARYETIRQLQGCIQHAERRRRKVQVDDVVLHRFWGIPIFLGIMYLVFWVTLSLGGVFIDFFDILFGAVFVDGAGALLRSVGSPDWLTAFLADGAGGGIQTISTFIPVIFFMFLMLSILEDSGYMARAAFVMDRFMRMIGLPGKAFVPMLIGFGCTVPAIMATRTLENKRDRFLTMFMVPFMSCGARLPVYALFAVTFFSRTAGLAVFSIYLAGILLAVLTGLIMKRTLFTGTFSPFVMELPEYHVPRPGKVLREALYRLRLFVFRAGKVILLAVLVLTLLNSWGLDGSFGNEDTDNSVLSAVGRTITPIFTPMGVRSDNWQATVGLFTGIFAKEAVIGTLTSLYSMEAAVMGGAEDEAAEPEEGSESFFPIIGAGIREAFGVLGENFVGLAGAFTDPLGLQMVSGSEEAVSEAVETDIGMFSVLRARFSPAAAYAYMLFVLVYFPCVAALGAVLREAGKFYGWLMAGYVTVLAWVVSTFVYQLLEGRSILWILISLAVMAGVYLSLAAMGRNRRSLRGGRLSASTFM